MNIKYLAQYIAICKYTNTQPTWEELKVYVNNIKGGVNHDIL